MRMTAIEAAVGHLGAAIVQSSPKDDQIIMDHVRCAYEILKVVRDADRKNGHDPSPAEKRLAQNGDERGTGR